MQIFAAKFRLLGYYYIIIIIIIIYQTGNMQHIHNLSAIYPNKVVQGERTKYWYECSIATFLMPRCWKFRRDLS